MSTDFQQARISLGARLRELRTEARLTVRELARRCGWVPSKISKLENGKQTATLEDLEVWARETGQPKVTSELKGRLRGLETSSRSWRRQLAAGHRALQELNVTQEKQAQNIRLFEPAIIPGVFQTPEYARSVLTDVSERLSAPRDIEAGVRARMKRQEALYEPGHLFQAVIWEAALHTLRCSPAVMAAQLDRLAGLIGLDTVTLGIIPFGVRMKFSPKHGFWIIDDSLVIADTWNAELWLDSTEDVAFYAKTWSLLHETAAYGPAAHRLIVRARTSLGHR
ncbi:helix-turn-helix domain-containing protein [Streptomyces gobiensis]|uniref:helix-turn-helix domain-containing protein n=1 Tax=Streptomyces gobiensis TaxID=2875706 RepID=UPI001E53E81C|nr:helix-turn-helix transcriptional regulator [Streptomyces gobiensis]UGY91150.1 helix-turn-helix transcriptional regulator [Streptomyces gobiensis]